MSKLRKIRVPADPAIILHTKHGFYMCSGIYNVQRKVIEIPPKIEDLHLCFINETEI